jgi:hypothetical protein
MIKIEISKMRDQDIEKVWTGIGDMLVPHHFSLLS